MSSPNLAHQSTNLAQGSRCIELSRHFYTEQERPLSNLQRQLKEAEEIIDALVDRPLMVFQKEALTCLVADIIGGFASSPKFKFPDSSLLKALNRGMFQIATAEFCSFCFTHGRVSTKAWNKRECEQLLFSRNRLDLK